MFLHSKRTNVILNDNEKNVQMHITSKSYTYSYNFFIIDKLISSTLKLIVLLLLKLL